MLLKRRYVYSTTDKTDDGISLRGFVAKSQTVKQQKHFNVVHLDVWI